MPMDASNRLGARKFSQRARVPRDQVAGVAHIGLIGVMMIGDIVERCRESAARYAIHFGVGLTLDEFDAAVEFAPDVSKQVAVTFDRAFGRDDRRHRDAERLGIVRRIRRGGLGFHIAKTKIEFGRGIAARR